MWSSLVNIGVELSETLERLIVGEVALFACAFPRLLLAWEVICHDVHVPACTDVFGCGLLENIIVERDGFKRA